MGWRECWLDDDDDDDDDDDAYDDHDDYDNDDNDNSNNDNDDNDNSNNDNDNGAIRLDYLKERVLVIRIRCLSWLFESSKTDYINEAIISKSTFWYSTIAVS